MLLFAIEGVENAMNFWKHKPYSLICYWMGVKFLFELNIRIAKKFQSWCTLGLFLIEEFNF
jgi:hypothetical protein